MKYFDKYAEQIGGYAVYAAMLGAYVLVPGPGSEDALDGLNNLIEYIHAPVQSTYVRRYLDGLKG